MGGVVGCPEVEWTVLSLSVRRVSGAWKVMAPFAGWEQPCYKDPTSPAHALRGGPHAIYGPSGVDHVAAQLGAACQDDPAQRGRYQPNRGCPVRQRLRAGPSQAARPLPSGWGVVELHEQLRPCRTTGAQALNFTSLIWYFSANFRVSPSNSCATNIA